MRAVLGYALAGALAMALLTQGCASVPDASDTVETGVTAGRKALGKALEYASYAVSATEIVCQIDRAGRPCNVLIAALNAFFEQALKVEAAINMGDDVGAAVEELESVISQIRSYAENTVRSLT